MQLTKQRNCELESDMEACRVREAELLLFTQQLTDKNVRLQSEFTSMETKVLVFYLKTFPPFLFKNKRIFGLYICFVSSRETS